MTVLWTDQPGKPPNRVLRLVEASALIGLGYVFVGLAAAALAIGFLRNEYRLIREGRW